MADPYGLSDFSGNPSLQLTILGAAALIAVNVTHVASIPALGAPAITADLFWFLLGFFFYASAFAAVASLVSRQEDVQSAIAPMGILLLAGYVLVFAALPDPTSPVIAFCSLLPPFAQVLMAVRICGGPAPVGSEVPGSDRAKATALARVRRPQPRWRAGAARP
jgi:ABC-2 type transport system permease protein